MVVDATKRSIYLKPLVPKFRSVERTIEQFYRFVSNVGEGGQGKVSHMKRISDNKSFAVKKEPLKDKRNQRDEREIQCLAKLNHFTCLKPVDVFYDRFYRYIVTELCSAGSLDFHVKHNHGTVLKHIHSIAFQLFSGIAYLHSQNVVHCDIKPGNVFVDLNGLIKIGDFGISCSTASPSSSFFLFDTSPKKHGVFGTEQYLSPEAFVKAPPAPPRDNYALGVTIFELISGIQYNKSKLFAERKSHRGDETVMSLKDHYLRDFRNGERLTCSPLDNELFRIVQLLTQNDPAKRPTSNELLSSSYFQEAKKNFIFHLNSLVNRKEMSSAQKIEIERNLRAQCGVRPFPHREEDVWRKHGEMLPISSPFFKAEVKNIFWGVETTHENAGETAHFLESSSPIVGNVQHFNDRLKPFAFSVEPSLYEKNRWKEENGGMKGRSHCDGALLSYGTTCPSLEGHQTFEIGVNPQYVTVTTNVYFPSILES